MVFGFPVNTTAKVGGFEVGLPKQICGPKAVNGNYGCVVDTASGHAPMTQGGVYGDKTRASTRTGLNRAGPRRRLDSEGAEGTEVQLESTEPVQVQGSTPPPPTGSPPPPAGSPPPPAGTSPPPAGSPPPPAGSPPPPAPAPAPAPTNGTPPPQGSRTISTVKPATFTLAARYAANNGLFLREFAKSFAKMTTVGYGTPAAAGATTTGKLGKVTGIDLAKCPV